MNVVRPSRRDLIFGGATLCAGAVAFARMPRKRIKMIGDNQLDQIVPDRIGSWSYNSNAGIVQPPPDQLQQLLYSQQVARTYDSSDLLPVMLLMAYGSSQSGMLQIHRPEICYPASGFKLTETRAETLNLPGRPPIPVRRFEAQSDTRVEHVLYWTRIGNLLPSSWTEQRIAVMRSNLEGFVPDGLLVRMSVVSQNAAQAQQMIEQFARDMLNSVGPKGRAMLIGPAAG